MSVAIEVLNQLPCCIILPKIDCESGIFFRLFPNLKMNFKTLITLSDELSVSHMGRIVSTFSS